MTSYYINCIFNIFVMYSSVFLKYTSTKLLYVIRWWIKMQRAKMVEYDVYFEQRQQKNNINNES